MQQKPEYTVALTVNGFMDVPETCHQQQFDSKLNEIVDHVERVEMYGPGRNHRSPDEYAPLIAETLFSVLDDIHENTSYTPDEVEVVAAGHSKGGNIIRYLESFFADMDHWEELNQYPSVETNGAGEELNRYLDNDIPIDKEMTVNTPHGGTHAALLLYPLSQATEMIDPGTEIFQGPKALLPGSDYLQEQNSNGTRSDIEYLNIVGASDPLLPNKENAMLPSEPENITNRKIGKTPVEAASSILGNTIQLWNRVSQDFIRDMEDGIEVINEMIEEQNPAVLTDPDNLPRTLDPKMMAFNGGIMYNRTKEDLKDALQEHVRPLNSRTTFREIEEFLGDSKHVQ